MLEMFVVRVCVGSWWFCYPVVGCGLDLDSRQARAKTCCNCRPNIEIDIDLSSSVTSALSSPERPSRQSRADSLSTFNFHVPPHSNAPTRQCTLFDAFLIVSGCPTFILSASQPASGIRSGESLAVQQSSGTCSSPTIPAGCKG